MTSPMRQIVIRHYATAPDVALDAPYFLDIAENVGPALVRGMSRTFPMIGKGVGPGGKCPFLLYRRNSRIVRSTMVAEAKRAERRSTSAIMMVMIRSKCEEVGSSCGAKISSAWSVLYVLKQAEVLTMDA